VETPSAKERYYPEYRTDLTGGTWTNVAHSDNGVNSFSLTNLNYSTTDGSNTIIFVQANDALEFFRITGE